MQGCEQHKLHPDSDCEMCKFRRLVLPTGNFTALTSVTVQDEKIVTKEEIQDSEKNGSASTSSQSDQRTYIEIATEKVPEIKKRYYSYSLNRIWDDEDTPPPSEQPSIDLRSGNEDRQSPWDMSEQAYGVVKRQHFATALGRRISCPVHRDIQPSASMLMMKYSTCKACRSQYLELAKELEDDHSAGAFLEETLTNLDPRERRDWPRGRAPDERNNVGVVLDYFNSRDIMVVDVDGPRTTGQTTVHIGVYGSYDSSHENYHDRTVLSKAPCNTSTWMPEEDLHVESAYKLTMDILKALHESRMEIIHLDSTLV